MQRSSDVKRSAGGTIKEVCSFLKYYRPVEEKGRGWRACVCVGGGGGSGKQ